MKLSTLWRVIKWQRALMPKSFAKRVILDVGLNELTSKIVIDEWDDLTLESRLEWMRSEMKLKGAQQ